MREEINILLKQIEEKLDWGSSSAWLTRDFENLSQRIFDETGVSLSVSTLRRIWGKVEYTNLPSGTTLDALAKFAGFVDWRYFVKQQANKTGSSVPIQPSKPQLNWKRIAPLAFLLLIVGVTGIIAFSGSKRIGKHQNESVYHFSSKPLTHDLPNSVVFTYDAKHATSDSVFIQQSWDPRTRTAVDKSLHEYTSIYYEPGFYQAKLLVDNDVVKEHSLLIPTRGWCGIIENHPVPIYLEPAEFLRQGTMNVPIEIILKKNITMQPQPPVIKYFNVGNFQAVPVTDFSFSAELKNEYTEGAAACGRSYVMLVTNGVPIGIPLSAIGCVSELTLFDGKNMVSGKTADLSAFGVSPNTWITVSCKSSSDRVRYFINEKQVYETPMLSKDLTIVGIGFLFQGTGSVKNIMLKQGDSTVFPGFDKHLSQR